MTKAVTQPKRPRGRQTTYTQEAADLICERLSQGIPLAEICRDKHMPAVRTVSAWKKAHEDFAASFARARDEGFDAIAADCLRIADDSSRDTKYVAGKDGEERPTCDAEWISRSKLRVETRLKLLAKWDPKRYGDKFEVDHQQTVQFLMLNGPRRKTDDDALLVE